jgi:hypothetical protein
VRSTRANGRCARSVRIDGQRELLDPRRLTQRERARMMAQDVEGVFRARIGFFEIEP